MKLIQIIRQHFCRHIDYPNNRNYQTPFLGHMFQCPRCKGYVVYFKEWDGYYDIPERKYILYTEEGIKLWERWNCKEKENEEYDGK